MKKELLKIAIAEPSVIVRSGLTVALKRIPGFRIQPFEIVSIESLTLYLRMHKPDVLIFNPTFWGYNDINKLKSETQHDDIKCLALLYSAVDESVLKSYDDSISIYDSVEQIAAKLEKLYASETDEVADETSSLSTREKEIVIAVVKGMTNKEIAEQLFLSTHTVISHRRNIARKLEIHSTAGLTIYAIVNKLVELEEIKKNMIL